MLDCTNLTRAASSAAALLGLSPDRLALVIEGSADIDPSEVELEAALWDRVLDAGGREPGLRYLARFMHATRSLSPDSFLETGILRLPESLDPVWAGLKTLAPEIGEVQWDELRAEIESGDRVGRSVPARRYRERACLHGAAVGGAHGFLIRDVAIAPPSDHHDYTRLPEIVEDIAMCAPPAWRIAERFMGSARPLLVHFAWPVDCAGYVRCALAYLWAERHGGSLATLTDGVDAGASVPASYVLEVEELDSGWRG